MSINFVAVRLVRGRIPRIFTRNNATKPTHNVANNWDPTAATKCNIAPANEFAIAASEGARPNAKNPKPRAVCHDCSVHHATKCVHAL